MADIPGWRGDNIPEGANFSEDRAYLETAIKKLEASGPQSPGLISQLLETSRERQFFELSLHNRMINNEYVTRRLDTEFEKDAAMVQLEDFLSGHEAMRTLPAVLDLRAQLL